MDFDLILDYLGHWGRFQLIIVILCGLGQFFGAMQFYSNVFLAPNASRFACACNDLTLDCEQQVLQTGLALSCDKYVKSHTGIGEQLMVDFNLVNDEKEQTISSSVFGLGAMLGSIGAGICADKYGRYRVMKISTVVMLVSSISKSFTLNFESFCFLQFTTGIAVTGLLQTGYLIAVEMVGTSKRPMCVSIMQLVFISGKLFLGLAAYYVGSWRSLELLISLPAVLMLIYFWWLPESIRWLIFKGKYSKALLIVLKAAKWNKVDLPQVLLRDFGFDEIDCENDDNFIDGPQECFGPCVILRSPEIREWSLTMCFVWVVNSMVYYDISSNSGNLSQNMYANFAMESASEIPAVLFAMIVLYYFQRRHTTCFVMILGAVFCVVTAFIPQGHPIVCGWIGILSKSFISASYTIIFLYSAEIFPTSLRGTIIGFNAMFFHFGGILAPFIFELRKIYCPLPSMIFAVASVISGILALKLPERVNWQLPESIGECLAFGIMRASGLSRLYRPRSYMTVPKSNLSINEETHLLKEL